MKWFLAFLLTAAAFGQRRKMQRTSLKAMPGAIEAVRKPVELRKHQNQNSCHGAISAAVAIAAQVPKANRARPRMRWASDVWAHHTLTAAAGRAKLANFIPLLQSILFVKIIKVV